MSDSIAAAKALAAAAANPRSRSVYRAGDGLRFSGVLPSSETPENVSPFEVIKG